MRLAIVVSHVIPYLVSQYRALAQQPDVELRVFFGSLAGAASYADAEFGTDVSWGEGLTDGYDWQEIPNRMGALKDALDAFAPDWLLIYGYTDPMSRGALAWQLTARRTRLAYVSDSEDRGVRDRVPRVRAVAKSLVVPRVFARVDAFLTVGPANEDYYRARGIGDARLIRMGFPIERRWITAAQHLDQAALLTLRSEFGVPAEALMVVNSGKFLARKRQQDLIEAVASPKSQGIHVVFAGAGPEEDGCRSMARGMANVHFAGFVQPDLMAKLLRAADVYAHVSDYDPHPLAVSEAAASGCALVVADTVGSWGPGDDVEPFTTGFVVPMGDTSALRGALTTLDQHRELTARYAAAAAQAAESRQDVAHGAFLKQLRDLQNRPRGRR